ncbi:AAA family ATPase [Mycobacterium sp. KBS0706]|uniref:AAA family ATPase n=1 Tax=Mycobacterium sp. KBS0706 TaxID=2578109 RepID=UPI00163D9F8C|nr:AAA family ATPase [Mycobacterium sp. KBS0706]
MGRGDPNDWFRHDPEGPRKGADEAFARQRQDQRRADARLKCRLNAKGLAGMDMIASSLGLVRGLLGAGGLSCVYGPPASLKSFLVLDLAFAIARGRPWRGLPVKQGLVLYLAAEGGAGVCNRITAYRRGHDGEACPVTDETTFVTVTEPVDLVHGAEGMDLVLEACEVAAARYGQKVALVVIDTLARCFGGESDSDTGHMNAFVQSIGAIARRTGAHVLIVHHSGKVVERGARGANALPAAIDTEIEVSRNGRELRATARVRKNRDGVDGRSFPFRVEVIELGQDSDGVEVSSCVVRHPDRDEPERAEAPEPAKKTMTPDMVLALRSLHEALSRQGQTPAELKLPPSRVPPSIHLVVKREAWKQEAYSTGFRADDDKPDTRDKAFRRAEKALHLGAWIAGWTGFVWIVKPADEATG